MTSWRKKKKEKAADFRNAILVGLAGAILIGGILGGAWWIYVTREKVDQALCPLAGPRAIQVLLIDQTDPITRQNAEQVKQYVERLVDKAIIGERFDLYTIKADTKNVLEPDLQVCFPGRGDGANELYQNPRRMRQRFEEKFLIPLRGKLDELLAETSRPSSPILESLKAAAISSFGRFERRDVPLRLSIVSDMIQHTPEYSHFRNTTNFNELANLPAWPALRSNLKGAEVTILYIPRLDAKRANRPIQDRGHQLFWERVILDSDGRLNGMSLL
jgi:hypothetical protein